MFLVFQSVVAERYFVLDVNYISGSLTFNSIILKEVDRAVRYSDFSGFLIKLKSFDDAEIQKMYYDMSSNKNYQIYLPYSKEAARIEVYNPSNSKVMDIEVASFADTCGNNACEDYESYESCTKDCHSGEKDDFCDAISDGICDPDCTSKTDADCAESEKPDISITQPTNPSKKQSTKITQEKTTKSFNYLLWGSIIIAAIVPILIFTFVRKRKEQALANTLKQYILENIQKGFTLQQIKNTLYREGYTDREINKAVRSI